MNSVKIEQKESLQHYVGTWREDPELEGLAAVIGAIADGTRRVARKVQTAAIDGLLGTTGEVNIQQEIVQHLDKIGSDTFVDVLSRSDRVGIIGSEEIEAPVIVGADERHRYVVLMDPLDGSSNLDVAVSVGSIFGIWEVLPNRPAEDSLLQPGRQQVAAAYTIYGSSTLLVVATRNRVDGFTLDPSTQRFLHTHNDIRIPKKCLYYSVNEGNYYDWNEGTQNAVNNLRASYSLRYVGSLVADFHRDLLKGGIFLYPGDLKSVQGKLRLMYEANPLGFIAEQAGGAASSGSQRILDIQPDELHQRVPLFIGNKDVVKRTVKTVSDA